jgi:hypothetical protein
VLIGESGRVRPEPRSARFFRYNPASFGPLRLTTGMGVAVFANPIQPKYEEVDTRVGKFTESRYVPPVGRPEEWGCAMSVSILIVDQRFHVADLFRYAFIRRDARQRILHDALLRLDRHIAACR